jgi:uncharacterized protein
MQAILLITRNCNFACDYCYAGEKRALDMAPELIASTAALLLGRGDENLGVGFCGGEPLLRFDLIRRAVEELEHEAGPGRTIRFSIATNGSLVDDEAADFFERHGFMVQVSLDGNRAMQAVHRRSREGAETFESAAAGVRRLLARALAVDVVTVVEFFTRDLQAPSLCLNVDFLAPWTEDDRRRLGEAFRALASRVAESYRRDRPVSLNLFDEKIRAHIEGRFRAEDHCPFGRGKIAIDVDGDIYPCDRIARAGACRDLVIGRAGTGIDDERAAGLIRRLRRPQDKCLGCEAAGRCRSWCGCVNTETTGSLGASSDMVCFVEKLVIACADEMAGTLFDEQNPRFLSRFYG